MEYYMQRLLIIVAQLLASVLVISLHEFAHAFAAYKCGDPTAKYAGRMTLNPLKHFDPMGMLLFALAGFGWAKPVPINPNNFDNYKKGSFWTAIAGVLANFLSAFLFYPLLVLVWAYILPLVAGKYAETFLFYLFNCLYAFSLSFCVFNLLPLYPLDGFRLLDALDKRKGKIYWFLRQYGHYILLGLVFVHFFADMIPLLGFIDILGYFMSFATNILGWPITRLWTWLFGLIGL